MKALDEKITLTGNNLQEYERLLDETAVKTAALTKHRNGFNEAAAKYIAACNAYMTSQDKQQDEEFKSAVGGAASTELLTKLQERAWKKNLANNIITDYTNVRLAVWKGMAMRDTKVIEDAQRKFAEINAKLDELQAKTRVDADIKAIEDWRNSGKEYSALLGTFLNDFAARDELGKKRVELVNVALQAARDTGRPA